MKVFSRVLIFILSLVSNSGLYSQVGNVNGVGLPLQPNGSPLFGKDIVINDTAMGDQRNVAICSAFNGWLYAAYWVKEVGSNAASMQLTIMKSEDSGIHWNPLRTFPTGAPTEIFTSFKIATCGNSLSNLKLFLGLIFYDTLYNSGTAIVARYDGITGAGEAEILNDQFVDAHYLDIATDFNYPASNSDPGTFAILYAKRQGPSDSLIFRSSSDGGITLNNHKMVAVSSDQFHFSKVALNYGRSSSYSDGRYFAAWELKSDNNSDFDHIYTAHSEPNISGSFTDKVCLDSIDLSTINRCQNPVICCQFGDFDNDSSNMTEIILTEKQDTSNNYYKLVGFYNRNAATANHFTKFNLTSTTHYETQPSINFNPYDSTFIVTYYDSTDQKLPFVTNTCDFFTPDSWQIPSAGYNDNSFLTKPNPKVVLSLADHNGVNAWISDKIDGKGIALFDSPNSTYTGLPNENLIYDTHIFKVYPNPCSLLCDLDFELEHKGNVEIKLLNFLGQILLTITNQNYSEGKYKIQVDMSSYPQGTYFFSFITNDYSSSNKIIVIR